MNFRNIDVLGKGLNAVWQKNEAISANIANADTPGYKALRVSFEHAFQDALSTGGKVDLDNLKATVEVDRSTSMREDKNNVDLDQEMADLAKNTILYDTLVHVLSKELSRYKIIITEGK